MSKKIPAKLLHEVIKVNETIKEYSYHPFDRDPNNPEPTPIGKLVLLAANVACNPALSREDERASLIEGVRAGPPSC